MGKIYTKTGDKGTTALFGGTRVSKAHSRVDTYGTVDELNSFIGVVISALSTKSTKIASELTKIQHDLFDIGATLANPISKEISYLDIRVKIFETLIDEMTSELPSLTNFILPSGSLAGSQLHFARTIARRCERRIIAFSEEEMVQESIKRYFNRLSDLLFTMARFVNQQEKKTETIWKKA